jgi:hypothetical protein
MINTYKHLDGKPEGKRPLGRPGSNVRTIIALILQHIRYEVVDWIHLAQHRDHWLAPVNKVMNLSVPPH